MLNSQKASVQECLGQGGLGFERVAFWQTGRPGGCRHCELQPVPHLDKTCSEGWELVLPFERPWRQQVMTCHAKSSAGHMVQ